MDFIQSETHQSKDKNPLQQQTVTVPFDISCLCSKLPPAFPASMLGIQSDCNANLPMGVHRVKPGQQQYCVIGVRATGQTTVYQIEGLGMQRQIFTLQQNGVTAVHFLFQQLYIIFSNNQCTASGINRLMEIGVCSDKLIDQQSMTFVPCLN